MPKKKKKSFRSNKICQKERMQSKRNEASSFGLYKAAGLSTGSGDPAPSRGKSLNALRLAPPQGSLPTQAKGIPPRSDSLQCVCAPVSAPSPKCEAGQTKLADSLPSVCTPKVVPSPTCDAARRLSEKDARNKEHEKTIEHEDESKKMKRIIDLSKQMHDEVSIEGSSHYQTKIPKRVLQGSFHQGDSIFGSNAGKQCVANSLCCIAYLNIHPVYYWKPEDIDNILHSGNELYTYLQNSSTIQNEYLLVNELPKDLEIFDTFMKFNYGNTLVGLLKNSLNEDLLDNDTEKMDLSLSAALQKMFSSYEHCFMTFGGNTFAIFCLENTFHVFDSHARSSNGRACPNGKATLICYDNIQNIVAYCYTLSKSLGIPQDTQFEITAVRSQKNCCETYSLEDFETDNKEKNDSKEKRVERCEDVILSSTEFTPHKFCPLSHEDRQKAINKLRLLSRSDCRCCRLLDSTKDCQFDIYVQLSKDVNKPSAIHKIKGDGNCFFRAVSYAIFGSEEQHPCLRHMACDFLKQNPGFLFKHTSAYNSASDYLQKSSMYSLGTWATAIEIIALSIILGVSVYTYSNNKWLRYSEEVHGSKQGIYLNHANGNHYDVVLDVYDTTDFHMETLNSIHDDSDNKINSKNEEQEVNSKTDYLPAEDAPKIDNLLDKYFSYQKEQLILKKNLREHKSRQAYMQSYMQKWREKGQNRANELKQDQQRKQNIRQNKAFRAMERETEQKSKRKIRMHCSTGNLERNKDRKRKELFRSFEETRQKEREKEKNQKIEARKNFFFRTEEKVKDQNARSKARQNRDYRTLEKEREKNSKSKYREMEEIRSIERNRDRQARSNARKNEIYRKKEKARETMNKLLSRQNLLFRLNEKIKDRKARTEARKNKEYALKERQTGTKSKKKVRENDENHDKEKKRDANRKRTLREDNSFKENERVRKCAKRSDKIMRNKEKESEKIGKAQRRTDEKYIEKEKDNARKRRYGKDLEECIEKFKKKIKEGPIYVCTCCHQTWFSHSVTNAKNIREKCKSQKFQACFSSYISEKDTEWICNTCKYSINEDNIPKLAVANKMGFPRRPPELDLHQLEERLVALRIPFMQIRELPRGGQLSIKGNVVNVPVEVQPTVNSLPRPFDESVTVSVRLKKKLSYKSCDLTENVRPVHVLAALHWLMKHSDLYKSSGIKIDDDWVSRINMASNEIVKEYLLGSDNQDEGLRDVNVATSPRTMEENSARQNDKECELDDNLEEEIDGFIEIDERETNSGNCDTIIDDANAIQENLYTFAPGEGQTPLSLYKDPDSEFLSFPSIYCGQRRPENKERIVKVNYSDIVKWELRSIDRRAAQNVPNIFFKMKKIQMKQISDKVNLVLRRCKTKGKKLTAKDVLDPVKTENLARLDEGYYIFRSLRNSPPYLESKKKEVFAMIRQLGLPTWFVSLSAADTRWVDQLSMLSLLNLGKPLTAKDVEIMSWAEKTDLVKKDPVNSVRYFNHRVQEFITSVLKSDHNPIGKVSDFFYRVEFQNRGSPHIHMLLWIENAPEYQKDSLEDIAAFIDKYVSCSQDVRTEEKEFVDMQMHRHSKSCRKRGKNVCRFNFPIPPMPKTTILEPLDDEEHQKYKDMYKDIQKYLSSDKAVGNFEEMLAAIGITEEEYLKAVRSTLDGPKVFLQRLPNESRVNPYMKKLLTAWGANHDLQYVLDPFACVVYIVNYISKAQRGMSTLLDEACKEAKNGNFDLRRQVRHMGNKFLNCVEISAQEASYLNLQLPLTQSTRDCVFINTAPPNERTFLLKQKEQLEKLPENSTDIEADNIIKRYSKRPKILENWCLADYASELNIVYPKKGKSANVEDEINDDEMDQEPEDSQIEKDNRLNITLKNGIHIKQRAICRLIRYVRYSLKVDPENFFRERILLFYPWRNEDLDVAGGFNSYEEHYFVIKETILRKVEKYERNAEELDRAQRLAKENCMEDEFDEVAPGNEQTQVDDAAEGSVESQTFAVFDPRRPESQKTYDIGQDLGLPASDVNHSEVILKRMNNDDYFANVRNLNVKQREFFLHILHWIHTKDDPIRVFLTGGAGVGKSVVVRLLHEALTRHLGLQDGKNPDLLRVLLYAPTGKAAYNIGGVTIHSAFGIPASQGFKCKPLSSDMLNSLRTKYRDLSVVIIDEVSMVGNMMLNLIHERLKQIKGSRDFFGGMHMILIGDLFQLKPVMDGWIFENLKSDFGPLATNLWQDLFSMHELIEIMRQKDDLTFSELLNRMREGNQTTDDLEILRGREVIPTSQSYPRMAMAPHLFISNRSVNDYNIQVFNSVQGEKTIVQSMDCFIGAHKSLNDRLQSLPKDASKTAGLHSEVHIGVGLKYEVTANLSVSDGITNGTSCTLKLIDRRQNNTSRPSIIWVEFDNPRVGVEWRHQYRHLYTHNVSRSWAPIFDVKRSFTYLKHNVMRIQFPLRIAAAKTVHKSQGDTVDEIVVDLTSNFKMPHVHYVALSRVRNMSGLNILNLNDRKMAVSEKVKEEMKRLRENAVLDLCYKPVYSLDGNTFKVGLLNVRSLRKHVKEIEFDVNCLECNVIAITETWLKEYHDSKEVSLQNFITYRQDGTSRSRGLLFYCHKDITVHEVGGYAESDIEFYILEVQHLNRTYQVVVLYRAPNCSTIKLKNIIKDKMKPLLDEVKHTIIAGDFNYDFRNNGSCIQEEFQQNLNCSQIVKKATHESGSLLDHIYTNRECKYTDVIETVFTDHKFVYACF